MLVFEIQNTKYFYNLLLLILKYKIQNIFIYFHEIQNIKYFHVLRTNTKYKI